MNRLHVRSTHPVHSVRSRGRLIDFQWSTAIKSLNTAQEDPLFPPPPPPAPSHKAQQLLASSCRDHWGLLRRKTQFYHHPFRAPPAPAPAGGVSAAAAAPSRIGSGLMKLTKLGGHCNTSLQQQHLHLFTPLVASCSPPPASAWAGALSPPCPVFAFPKF